MGPRENCPSGDRCPCHIMSEVLPTGQHRQESGDDNHETACAEDPPVLGIGRWANRSGIRCDAGLDRDRLLDGDPIDRNERQQHIQQRRDPTGLVVVVARIKFDETDEGVGQASGGSQKRPDVFLRWRLARSFFAMWRPGRGRDSPADLIIPAQELPNLCRQSTLRRVAHADCRLQMVQWRKI